MGNNDNTNFWGKSYNEMTVSEKNSCDTRVTRISDLVLQAYYSASERAIKALLLINSGGIITILSYLHGQKSNCFLISSLVVFIFGLLLAFILVVSDFFACKYRMKIFDSNTTEMRKGNKLPEKVPDLNGKNPIPESVQQRIMVIGILSGIAAVLGIVLGLIGFPFDQT